MKKRFDGARILVVDDEPAIREFLSEEFSDLGAKTECACNATEAMRLLAVGTFDLVVTDARMPGGDGVELLRRIAKEISPKPGIVFLTGYSDVASEEIASLGADFQLWKPFQLKELNDAAEKAVEKARAQRSVFFSERKLS